VHGRRASSGQMVSISGSRRQDTIIAQLTQRIPELDAPTQETPSAPPESPTTATEQPGRVDTGAGRRAADTRLAPVVAAVVRFGG
jgi:hypothetical protein